MFGSCQSFYEAVSELIAEYETRIENLPNPEILSEFMSSFPEKDDVTLTFESIETWTYNLNSNIDWVESYEKFVFEDNNLDDEVQVKLVIKKEIVDNISVYCFDKVVEFFGEKSTRELITLFSNLMAGKNSLRFNVIDKELNIFTKTIAFTNKEKAWSVETFDRKQALNRCEKASLFLNRTEIGLLPQDFYILETDISENTNLVGVFKRLETIFDYIYIANNSYLTNEKLVVQFSPADNAFDFVLDDIQSNSNWRRIYEWVFDSDTAIERASIARNIISINCKTTEHFVDITERIVDSIKSNYVIYQKSSVEQYLDAKKSIANSIVETSRQIQEMIYDIASGFSKNLIAVIMFFISIILTDSMDWEDLIHKGIPQDIVYMAYFFAGASIFYLLITIFTTYRKWKYCAESHNQLKECYEDILDRNDINQAFSNDKLMKDSKKRLILDAIIISLAWGFFLIFMVLFFTSMKCNPK